MGRRTKSAKDPAIRLVERHETVDVRSDGGLRIVVVADTHSRPHPSSARWIAAERPDLLLHAGDIGDLAVLDGLREHGRLVAIRGNIDVHAPDLPDVVTLDVRARGVTLFQLLLVHIAVYGPKLRAEIARLAAGRGASLVVCGHSHVPFAGRDKGLVVFNPGSIGPRRFDLPIVFGVIELDEAGLRMRHVDCETGERWLPGPARV